VFAEGSRRRAGALALFLTSVAAAGCVVEAVDSAPPPPVVVVEPGRLTVRWMVSERVDPNLCVLGRAAAIDISVSTTAGRFAGEFQAPCTAFATTISSLYPDTYVADALLIDSFGIARTTDIELRPFTVLDRSELIIDVDFPADSFLDGVARDAIGQSSGPDAAARAGQSAPPAPQSMRPRDATQSTSP
jgi:hypothetical protein